jgi:putative inorganic carbon (HCO3(-)) transporter
MSIARLCLLLAVFLLPLLGGKSGVLPLAIFAVLATGGWLGWATVKPRPGWRAVPLGWPLLAVLGVSVLATVTSVYRPASVLGIWQAATVAALTLLAFQVPLTRAQLWAGARLFGAGVLISLLYGFWGSLTWVDPLAWRVQSTWENANFYAAFLLLSLPLLAVLARIAPRQDERVGYGLVVLLGLAALVLTQSRGGLLAFLLALLVIAPAWLWAEGKLSAKGIGLLAAAFVVFLGLVLVSPLGKRVLDPALRAKQLHSQMFRVYTWQSDLRMIQDRPLLGFGPGTFPSVFGRYQIAGYTRHGHQIYLQAAAESGVLGLAALLWLFGAVGAVGIGVLRAASPSPPAPLPEERGGKAARLVAVGLLGGLLALALHGLVDSDWLYPGIQLTLLLGAALVWHLRGDDRRETRMPAWAAAALPIGMLAISLALLTGTRAEQAMADGEGLLGLAMVETDARRQSELFQEALTTFRGGVNLAPTNARYLRQASIYVPRDEGRDYLLRAQAIEPTNSANWLFWGNFCFQGKQYADARAAYTRAVREQPHLHPALYGLGKVAWKLGDRAAALAAMTEILATIGTPLDVYHPIEVPEPWYTQAWYAKAVLLHLSGDRDEASKAYGMAMGAAAKYERGFSKEAEAWAAVSRNDSERAQMRALAATAHLLLRELRPDTSPLTDDERKLALPKGKRGEPFP